MTGASDRPSRGNVDDSSGKLWGARADYVASLGRKVADARDVIGNLIVDPASPGLRDDLRRRLHALGAAARLLRFDAMAKALGEADLTLERAGRAGVVEDADFDVLGQILDELPALAWSEESHAVGERGGDDLRAGGDTAGTLSAESAAARTQLAVSALVFGGEDIGAALSGEDEGSEIKPFEVERTTLVQGALDTARAIGPDVVIIDAEITGAASLVESLLDDPLTEPVPIVVLGEFPSPETQGRYVALGVAKVLVKPVTPDELRRVCEELVDQREGRTVRITLGEPTLEQLGERLADEMRRALVECVDSAGRAVRVPLGEGTEVLGAVWGAIARVREVVTARTGGSVRFGGGGPEGAIAVAPWLHGDAIGTSRGASRTRGGSADVRLDGRRVVVADDDPGVTWFMGDLLRAAGCEVHEALDGRAALDLCYRVSPELVVSDILMPELDGFALSRAIKHDVVLRDTPVILLSWKEDLLQRVRELGGNAAAYMRKESDSRAILARVREVLRPRVRVETRLRGDGEVRGRLDGLTVHSLLGLVCRARRAARISVRDATYLYEVEVRDGAPRRATRTAPDGSFQRGERVLAAMLGIGAGRFVVGPSFGQLQGDLAGTLAAQLAKPVAAARGALHAVTGQNTVSVHGLVLDDTLLDGYLRATPEPMRDVIQRLAKGASPRAMLLAGEVSPTVLEDVLADLAAHGAITAVRSVSGDDLLSPAVDDALSTLEGRGTSASRAKILAAAPATQTPVPLAAPPAPSSASFADLASPTITHKPSSNRPPRKSPPPPAIERELDDGGVPTSLADAVMRELVERGSEAPFKTPMPPPMISPAGLRARSSTPPALEAKDEDDAMGAPSLPPDAMVPASTSQVSFDSRSLADAGEVAPASISKPAGSGPFIDEPPESRSPAALSPEPSIQIPVVEGTPAPDDAAAKTDGRNAYTVKLISDAELQQTPPPAVAAKPERATTKGSSKSSWVIGALLAGGSIVAFTSIAGTDRSASNGGASSAPVASTIDTSTTPPTSPHAAAATTASTTPTRPGASRADAGGDAEGPRPHRLGAADTPSPSP